MQRFMCLYAQELSGFRITELQSILTLLKIKVELDLASYNQEKPFLVIATEDEKYVKEILSRSVLIRYIIKLWGYGTGVKEMVETFPHIRQIANTILQDGSSTFSFRVEAYNKKLTMDDKKFWIQELESENLDFGQVDLKNPTHALYLLLDFRESNTKTKPLHQIYFGELVGTGQRHLIQHYSLKTRYFIGNTSMDPQLSFLMASQGKVTRGSLVYDPFVGTGSILTCCAHFGAFIAGSDIDYSIIYGRGKSSRAGHNGWRARDEQIRTNFCQYGLTSNYLDVMAADISMLPFREQEIFDAIITDPPYGIREGGRQQLATQKATEVDDSCSERFPAIAKQKLSGTVLSLIDFASIFLCIGGRLVYWLPVYRPSYDDSVVPKHPCFTLIANCEQQLTKKISRRLITMEKICSLKDADEHHKLNKPTGAREEWRNLHDQFRDNYFSVTKEG